ncbi:hypothetical protein JNW90_14680 [Micromonospora sp. STR1s_5]|nr:hypothetical protein [Micromonospora sp. STR1s_5]
MSVSPFPPGGSPDPLAALEASAWALAAAVGTMSDALSAPLAEVLAAAPHRSAVLEAAGLLSWDGGVPVAHRRWWLPMGRPGAARCRRG